MWDVTLCYCPKSSDLYRITFYVLSYVQMPSILSRYRKNEAWIRLRLGLGYRWQLLSKSSITVTKYRISLDTFSPSLTWKEHRQRKEIRIVLWCNLYHTYCPQHFQKDRWMIASNRIYESEIMFWTWSTNECRAVLAVVRSIKFHSGRAFV